MKRLSITGVFIGMVIATVLGFAVLRIYQRNPLAKQWTYEGRFTVIDAGSLTLISYPSDEGVIIEMKLPEDAYSNVVEGYGYYRLEDILPLSRSEKRGDELLVDTVSTLIGVPIETSTSRISYWDQFVTWRMTQDNEIGRETIDLSDYPITITIERPDRSTIDAIDPAKIDFYFNEVFWERPIREENFAVGIFNASETPGLASTYGRILENVGFRIIDISNWDEEEITSDCQIRLFGSEELKETVSVQRLQSILSCPMVVISEQGRYDMQVIFTRSI